MISRRHPPKKKRPQEKRQPPAGAERTEREIPASSSPDHPPEEKRDRPWSDPITNQDEQEKITNSGTDDPIADK
jgi:hypothetical protein